MHRSLVFAVADKDGGSALVLSVVEGKLGGSTEEHVKTYLSISEPEDPHFVVIGTGFIKSVFKKSNEFDLMLKDAGARAIRVLVFPDPA